MKFGSENAVLLLLALALAGCSDSETETSIASENNKTEVVSKNIAEVIQETAERELSSDSSVIGKGDFEITFKDKVYNTIYTKVTTMKNGGPTPTTHIGFKIISKNYPLTSFTDLPGDVIDMNITIPFEFDIRRL